MAKFLENLQEAEKIIQIADHWTYVSFPLIKDKKLLLKTMIEVKKALQYCINSILQYEYLYKRIRLFKNPKTNFQTFERKCAKHYNISQDEVKLISELFDIVEKQKKSSMEFVKNNKIVILSENLETKTIPLEKIKEFLLLSKKILEKTKNKILQ